MKDKKINIEEAKKKLAKKLLKQKDGKVIHK